MDNMKIAVVSDSHDNKDNLEKVVTIANKSREADFIFYGHLYKVDVRKEGKTHILNPGESGGLVRKPTFFIVDMDTHSFEKILL
jgi:predicted phosphodiesterase